MPRNRILLVDDDVAVASSMAEVLRRIGGYEVRTEKWGGRAVQAARDFRPDLILLDVVMPDVDGGEIAAELAEDPHLRDVPIAFLTGMISHEEMGDMATDTRARRLIAKPIEPKDLVAVVRDILASEATS